MITLYDNPFSPFARKVRMVLWYKGREFRSVDALALEVLDELAKVNPRREVPVLVDGETSIVGSADVVAWLEDRYPTPSVLPGDPAARAKARRWQRIADTTFDAVLHDISIWAWPTHHRTDTPPPGLIEAGHRDLGRLLEALEAELPEDGFVAGDVSVGDFALFPHASSLRLLGVPVEPDRFPRVSSWFRAMRALPAVRRDLEHVKESLAEKFAGGRSPYEGEGIVWRGDRIEWLAANGFLDWWLAEISAGRAIVPKSL